MYNKHRETFAGGSSMLARMSRLIERENILEVNQGAWHDPIINQDAEYCPNREEFAI